MKRVVGGEKGIGGDSTEARGDVANLSLSLSSRGRRRGRSRRSYGCRHADNLLSSSRTTASRIGGR